jgi:protein-tyrosine-phosphatase/uncharacterized membrane-anchored protein YitT (DUF2179 family)
VSHRKRVYGLGIWGLGLGYYLFYTPYSGLTKALSDGLLPGVGRVPGIVLLPASVLATVFGIFGFITLMKWWKYAGRRTFFGVSVPFPRRLTFLSGVCMATIIGTTTLAFSFGGISIVLVLVLLRGGVLIIAPMVDAISRRRVRWFSWVAMLISLLAVTVVLGDAANYRLSLPAIIDVAAYLTAYFFKLQFMTRLAKTDEPAAARRYFVEEQMVASPLLLVALGALYALGVGGEMSAFRLGFDTLLSGKMAGLSMLVGLCYAGLCVCTTFIFLDRRENTFCVPMHCSSSMLSGLTAAYLLTFFVAAAPPSASQLVSAGLLVVALAFLSPLHHFARFAGKLRRALRRASPESVAGFGEVRQLFLFVCSGNTCRSPMAAAIANAEIAARLRIPFEALGQADLQALSAGLSARAGAPMTPEAQQALGELGITVQPHGARNVTVELIHQVERIFCMTQTHRVAVIDLVPAAAGKTLCLDPDGDVDDPIGSGMAAYVNCARRINELVRLRFDEISLRGGMPG